MNPDSTIVGSVAAATLVTYVGRLTDGRDITIRPLVGGFVTGSLLLALGMLSADVAKTLAILVLVTSVLVNGQDVFKGLGRLSNG